jgi:hypothetical protein
MVVLPQFWLVAAMKIFRAMSGLPVRGGDAPVQE